MKRISCLLVIVILILSMTPVVHAEDKDPGILAADALYELGLFKGAGINEDGSVNYALDRQPTRIEAVVMLVRLLGKEETALNGEWVTPFTDVPEWAKPYVGYAYENGLANGVASTLFGKGNVTASQYLTFVLRALGYNSSTDFKWNAAWELSDALGLTNGEYSNSSEFLRRDVAIISLKALSINQKSGPSSLAESLINEGVFTKDSYKHALASIGDNSAELLPDSPTRLIPTKENIFLSKNAITISWMGYKWLCIDGNFYRAPTTFSDYAYDKNGDLYVKYSIGYASIFGSRVYYTSDISEMFKYISGNYNVTSSDNPYAAGDISINLHDDGNLIISTKTEYYGANSSYEVYSYSYGGKTLTIDMSKLSNAFEGEIDGVRFADHGNYVNVGDFLEFFGHNYSAQYLNDKERGYYFSLSK